jgi:hypothetical protein
VGNVTYAYYRGGGSRPGPFNVVCLASCIDHGLVYSCLSAARVVDCPTRRSSARSDDPRVRVVSRQRYGVHVCHVGTCLYLLFIFFYVTWLSMGGVSQLRVGCQCCGHHASYTISKYTQLQAGARAAHKPGAAGKWGKGLCLDERMGMEPRTCVHVRIV